MRLHDYQKLAMRTLSSGNDQLLHGILGICGEVGELILFSDSVNMLEEVGDIMWYVACATDSLCLDMEDLDLDFENTDDVIADLQVQASVLADKYKRHIFYKVELDEEVVIKCLGCIIVCMQYFAAEAGETLEWCMERNIEKLSARYGDKFSRDAAIHRDIKKERDTFH